VRVSLSESEGSRLRFFAPPMARITKNILVFYDFLTDEKEESERKPNPLLSPLSGGLQRVPPLIRGGQEGLNKGFVTALFRVRKNSVGAELQLRPRSGRI